MLSAQYFTFLILLSLVAKSFQVDMKRKKIVQDGDFMIGALVPVHEQPAPGTKRCGVIRDQYGVQRVEALLYMLDKINNKINTTLLQGVKLGLEIRDECWETSIALEETIDFIKHTISSESIYDNNDKNEIFTKTNKTNDQEKCYQIAKESKENQNRILAVIGPGGSSIAINVQNLLQLFDIPQIGYSATSRDLSDKNMFKTFLRVVPSDILQVRAMIDVVIEMKWTYLFAIYTEGNYGQAGMDAFHSETSLMNICLAVLTKIRESARKEVYENLIIKMNKISKARVIVCFCYGETIRGLLAAIHRLNLKGRFTILGSDGWSDRIDVAQDYYEEAEGSLSIKAYSPLIHEFDGYFTGLNPSNNARNVWFNEYWEERFKCYLDESSKQKFPTSCKKKCPIGFVFIQNDCYYISKTKANWYIANNECSRRNAMLMNTNNHSELRNIHSYLVQNNLIKNFIRSHLKLEISSHRNVNNQSNGEKVFNYKKIQLSDDSRLKDRLCKSDRSGILHLKGSDPLQFSDQQSHEIFEIKRSQLDNECIVLNLKTSSQLNKDFSYCITFSKCSNKFPFICKLDPNKKKQFYYKNSLVGYKQDPKMSYIMNAFLSVVHGLHKAHTNICEGPGLCDKIKNINGTSLLRHIKDSKFIGMANEDIYFDKNGDPPGRYVILNVQKRVNKRSNKTSYIYKQVGNWNNHDKLSLNKNLTIFSNGKRLITSMCSEKCKFGHVKQTKQADLKCCWKCKKCVEYSYVLDDFSCQECPLGFWPNKNLTGCEKLPLVYLQWNEPATIFVLFISCVGIVLNTFVTHTFVKYANTSVVKSTTRELSFTILFGAYFAYLMTVPLVLKPSVITCCISRIMPGFSLSLMYGALVTKTHRISRILSRSKKKMFTKKLRFLSITAQLVITGIIISIECAFIIVAFILEPDITSVSYPERNTAQLECYNSILTVLGPLGYNIFIVALCTVYAVKTRNFPENFNEAKFIGFSMYTTCVIWAAFIPLYFGSDFKVITLCLSMSFSATVLLIFLFVPKVYIILFEPENNQRSAFVTSKDIRCHIGTRVQKESSENGKLLSRKVTNSVSSARNASKKSSFKQLANRSCQTSMQDIASLNSKQNSVKESRIESGTVNVANSDSSSKLTSHDSFVCNSSTTDDSFIKKEFTSAIVKEEDSLENFKNLFLQNDKITLNWDFVQSSEYL